nr:trans-resveratrol di-O-methyltransferase-like [Tanacetum cinerariifolium]
MALQSGEQSIDLLDNNHIFSFISSMSLKCAIQLQIPDIIDRHGAPMLLSESNIDGSMATHEQMVPKQRYDVTPFHTAHGKIIWDLAGHEPKLNHFFNEAMTSDARLVTSVILKHCGSAFEGLNSIVDVGGTKNLSYIGGDMFQAIPKADAIFVKILKRCKEAIPSKENGGKLIIIDMVVKNNEGGHHGIEFAATMYLGVVSYVFCFQLLSSRLLAVMHYRRQICGLALQHVIVFVAVEYRSLKLTYGLAWHHDIVFVSTALFELYCTLYIFKLLSNFDMSAGYWVVMIEIDPYFGVLHSFCVASKATCGLVGHHDILFVAAACLLMSDYLNA